MWVREEKKKAEEEKKKLEEEKTKAEKEKDAAKKEVATSRHTHIRMHTSVLHNIHTVAAHT